MANVTQNILHVPTDYDKLAALMGIPRLSTDTNRTLKAKLVSLWSFYENTSRQGMVNAISSSLGYDQYNVMTRRIYILSKQPKKTSTFTVTVDGVTQTRITEATYSTAITGYIVWKNTYGEFGRILEFINPPAYSRKTVSRKHAGSYVQIAYAYEEIDKNNVKLSKDWVDRCNLFDIEDTSYMGWAPETEGSVGIYALNDKVWLEDPTHGMKNADGTPTEKLYGIFHEVDRSNPTTWGE